MRKRIAEDPRMPSTAIAAQKTRLSEDKDTAFLAKNKANFDPRKQRKKHRPKTFPTKL